MLALDAGRESLLNLHLHRPQQAANEIQLPFDTADIASDPFGYLFVRVSVQSKQSDLAEIRLIDAIEQLTELFLREDFEFRSRSRNR